MGRAMDLLLHEPNWMDELKANKQRHHQKGQKATNRESHQLKQSISNHPISPTSWALPGFFFAFKCSLKFEAQSSKWRQRVV